jgi:hypothetical protein
MDPLEYVMNRMEVAAQSSNPAEMGYGDARRELIRGIETLRSRLVLLERVAEAANTLRTFQTLQYVTGRTDEEISERIKTLDAALRAYDTPAPPVSEGE